MGKLLQYARCGLQVGLPIIFCPTYINKYIKHMDKYPLEVRWARIQKLIRKVVKAFHCDIHIEGKENLPKDGRYLVISNHLSVFDALVYIAISDRPITFAAKEEALDMPFVGKVFRALNGVALDRKNVMNQLAEIKQIVNQIKDETMPLMYIFPEGTRNKEPQNHCLEFKGGSLKLAYMAKVPIVPFSTFGSFRVLDKKHYLKRYPIFIKIEKPIYPEEYKDIQSVVLADSLKERIDANVDSFRVLDKEAVYSQKLSKKRKEKETLCDNLPS
jgi:1-acyl-sn-glycerol-3-phosphate acyltransferase